MCWLVDLTADWSLTGTQYNTMRRLHSWRSAVYTLTGALVIAALIVVVFYCKIHRLYRTVCWRRSTSYDSQLEYVVHTSTTPILIQLILCSLHRLIFSSSSFRQWLCDEFYAFKPKRQFFKYFIPHTPFKYFIPHTPWVKKQDTKLLFIFSPTIDQFFKILSHSARNLQQKDHYRPRHTCRYTTLRNITLQKLHRSKAQQRQTRRAHMKRM